MPRTRILVISLSGSVERRALFAERARHANNDWEFFDAREELAPEIVYDEKAALLRIGRGLTPAELACYSSHYALWRQLIADDAAQYLILEDDVIADWSRLALLANVDLAASGIPLLRLYAKTPAPFVVRKRRWLTRTSHLIEFKAMSFGAQGYVITRAAASTLVEYARRAVRPVDDQIERFWDHGLPNLCLFPFPLIEEAGESTIGDQRFVPADQQIARKLYILQDVVRRRFSAFRRTLDNRDWTARRNGDLPQS